MQSSSAIIKSGKKNSFACFNHNWIFSTWASLYQYFANRHRRPQLNPKIKYTLAFQIIIALGEGRNEQNYTQTGNNKQK